MKFPGLLNRISGQIAALVVVSVVALHLIIATIFWALRPESPEAGIDRGHGQFIAAIQLLGTTGVTERPRVLADIERAFPQLDIRQLAPGTPEARDPDNRELHHLRHHLGPDYRIFALKNPHGAGAVGVVLPDGMSVSARLLPGHDRPHVWGGPWMVTLLFAAICLTLLGLWAARALTAPLSSFARAAEDFSLNGAAAPLPERGPEEIRSVAKALNRMRDRITGLIDDRTRMLAAISHDLRTPITRLRLRSEFIEDDVHRRHMLRDLDQMRGMLEAVLSFLRNDRRLEPMTLIDLASSLQLIADQFTDMGHKVAYHGPDHAMVMARPDDLHRAVTNLVDNAVHFAGETVLRLAVTPQAATIEVEDDGPGISDARKDVMLEPFVRGDEARNMDDASGFGLGLSITRAIVDAHGGTLSLNDRQPRGLIARIELPVGSQQQAA
ncbi:MAG TPA: ATP-binding protein [Nitrobacter sp.]|jgi:signal transduction histidine kinase|nr:ATP-binding protein [Nitrobacter sp.]